MPRGPEPTVCLVHACARRVLCHGRCPLHFREWKKNEPELYRALSEMTRAKRKDEIAKQHETEEAKYRRPWDYDPEREEDLATEFGQEK